MSKLSFPEITKKDLNLIKKRRLDHAEKRIRVRLNILWLTTIIDNAVMISTISGASIRHVFNVLAMYKKNGLDCLLVIDNYKPLSELVQYGDLIAKELDENPPTSAKEPLDTIYQLIGIKLSITQTKRFLKKLGMKYIKPTMVPMGSKETDLDEKVQKQKEFVDEKLENHIKDHAEGKAKLLFMDASHMQIACMLGFIWCFTRKHVPALPLRGRVNLLGAISPNGKDFVYEVTQDSINQEAIMKFLRKIAAKFKGENIRLILDNASYHHAIAVKELAEELGIFLEFLPVASPNLNIIERLWKFVKTKFLKNRVFTHLDELESVLKTNLKTLKKKYKHELSSLLTTNFQHFDETVQFVAS